MLNRRRFLGAGVSAFALPSLFAACSGELDLGPLAGTYQPDATLLDAARKEGGLVLYTANFLEPEQVVARAFARRFDGLKVELMRAPTGQMVTRVQTESAAGKLSADVIDISDRVLAEALVQVFGDYTPPNASAYPEESFVAGRLWPRTCVGWTISYNAVLATNPPRNWADLVSPEYTAPGLGQTIALAGAGPVTRLMFERKTFGRDYWVKQAALKPKLYSSQSPMSDALIRGEIGVAPMVTQLAIPLEQQGAPIKWFFGPEGVPVANFCAGLVKGCAHPNAARLFLDWSLSPEGQALLVTLGAFSAMKNGPVPTGVDAATLKPWLPEPAEYARVAATWTEDWNHDFGYRQ